MPNNRDAVPYALGVFWAVVLTVAVWRLTVLGDPHWLKLAYMVVAIAWVPVTVLLAVFAQNPELIGRRVHLCTLGAAGVLCAVFIGIGITDLCQ